MHRFRPALDAARLAPWCQRALGSRPGRVLFESGYLSQVLGVELADGRRVVVKVRPWADRLVACVGVHASLFDAGFPCPQPVTGVDKLDEWAVSAEALVPDHEQLQPAADSARLFAEALAQLVDVARLAPADTAALYPSPPWLTGTIQPGATCGPRQTIVPLISTAFRPRGSMLPRRGSASASFGTRLRR